MVDIKKQIERRRIPRLYRGIYRKAMDGRSRAAAIKAFCLECQGWDDGAREAVAECAAHGCPLHPYRPYQDKLE